MKSRGVMVTAKGSFLGTWLLAIGRLGAAGLVAPAFAQPLPPPDAGSLLRQLPPIIPGPLLRETPDDVLPSRSKAAPAGVAAPGARFVLRGVTVRGSTVYTEATLQALLQDAIDQPADLGTLEALAERIIRHYRAAGYTVARAYLPPQDIVDGRVEIAVAEGRYGAIVVRGERPVPIRLLPLQDLRPGDLVADAPLERALLLSSDLAGLRLTSTLQPGAEVGTSDLVIDLAPAPRLSGQLDLDNHGSPSTGRIRLGLGVQGANVLGWGDVLSARALQTQDDLERWGRLGWQLPLHASGTRVGMAVSELRYRLGDAFTALQAHGRADVATLNASQPLLRSRSANLNLQFAYDRRHLSDAIDATAVQSDKRLNVATVSVSGDRQDAGGATSYTVGWSHGRLALDSADTAAQDVATARSAGSYDRINVNVARQQALGQTVLSATLAAQWSSKNLDSSEKLPLGGADGVRAYPQGEAAGDHTALLTVELQRPVARGLQALALLDIGWARINARPWSSLTTSNQRQLSGAGLGLRWEPLRGATLQAVWSQRLTGPSASSGGSAHGRGWLHASWSI